MGITYPHLNLVHVSKILEYFLQKFVNASDMVQYKSLHIVKNDILYESNVYYITVQIITLHMEIHIFHNKLPRLLAHKTSSGRIFLSRLHFIFSASSKFIIKDGYVSLIKEAD